MRVSHDVILAGVLLQGGNQGSIGFNQHSSPAMVLAQVIGIGIGDAIMRTKFTAPPRSYADTVEDSLKHAILAVLAMDILAVEVQPTGIANSHSCSSFSLEIGRAH